MFIARYNLYFFNCNDFTIIFWHACMHQDFSFVLLRSVTFESCATVAMRCNLHALILCVFCVHAFVAVF